MSEQEFSPSRNAGETGAATPKSAAPKHTPGPWQWDSGVIPPDGPGRYSDIYVDGGDKIIASINEFREFSREEGLANARLIAAAPEMYEALEAARLTLTGRGATAGGLVSAINLVNAALRKAQGSDQ